jgi:hypothetical protein
MAFQVDGVAVRIIGSTAEVAGAAVCAHGM